jgi:hypothetical protein
MTALTVSAAAILAEVVRTYHDDRAGTLDGYNWHRATHTTPCLPCRDAHNDRVNRARRSPEHQRLLDAGVNATTARYLARVLPGHRARQALHDATAAA